MPDEFIKNMWINAAGETDKLNEDAYLQYANIEKKMMSRDANIEKKMMGLSQKLGNLEPPQWADAEYKEQLFAQSYGKVPGPEVPEPEVVDPRRQEEMLVWYPRKTSGGDYDDNTAALDPIHHYNIQDLLARFFIQTHAQWGAIKNWRVNCIGTTSFCFGQKAERLIGGAHMPMFDYDGRNVKTQIRKDVKLLQKDFELGDAWVYETRRGFHVYFFSDMVARDTYWAMLDTVQCCKGFERSARNRGYAILRVGAKYTDFDIRPLYVLAAESPVLKRMTRKAHTIQALIQLGEDCGTHFASMFPQWAHFKQDPKEWRPATKSKKIKRRKMPDCPKAQQISAQKITLQGMDASATTSTTYTVNTSHWTTNNGTGNGTF